jgi:hypothetical protein
MRSSILGREARFLANSRELAGAVRYGIAVDEVRLDEEWFRPFDNANLADFYRLVPQFSQITFPPMIRTVKDRESFVPWHQDSRYISDSKGLSAHEETITCFVPLNENPDDHPSLEFFLCEHQAVEAHVERRGETYNKFDLPRDRYPTPDSCIRPKLALGDAIVFGMNTLHRTFSRKDVFRPRYSIEYRLTRLLDTKVGKDYYDVNKRTFYKKRGD